MYGNNSRETQDQLPKKKRQHRGHAGGDPSLEYNSWRVIVLAAAIILLGIGVFIVGIVWGLDAIKGG